MGGQQLCDGARPLPTVFRQTAEEGMAKKSYATTQRTAAGQGEVRQELNDYLSRAVVEPHRIGGPGLFYSLKFVRTG